MSRRVLEVSSLSNGAVPPLSDADKEEILDELERVLASRYFRQSKKYPAFLRFIVEKTLNNESDELKERMIGVELFGRYSDYLTNDDPVVRVTAGEVRKRLAQYYQTEQPGGVFFIHLPVGSYAPQFRKTESPDTAPAADSVSDPPSLQEVLPAEIHPAVGADSAEVFHLPPAAGRGLRSRVVLPVLLGLLMLLFAFAQIFGSRGLARIRRNAGPVDALDAFWQPLLVTPQTILIYAQEVDFPDTNPSGDVGALNSSDHFRKTRLIPTATMTEIASTTAFLMKHDKGFNVQPSSHISFYDLQGGPFVVFGAIDDPWVHRLTDNLPFHIVREDNGTLRIASRQNPGIPNWSLDPGISYASQKVDYAIVARVRDQTTNQYAVVATGLGERGLFAAGRFLRSSIYAGSLAHNAPAWSKAQNVEIVISAPVMNGTIGPPRVEASCDW